MRLKRVGIDFGNNQRHPVIHAEVIAIINDHAAALDGLPSEEAGSALFPFRARKQGNIRAIKRFGGRYHHFIIDTIHGFSARACRKDFDVGNREIPFAEDL